MSFSFPKMYRLLKRREFLMMNRNISRSVGELLIVDSRNNGRGVTRLGITVSKRYGKSHDRNRFKRIVREAFRMCRTQLMPNIDINIKPRTAARKASSHDIYNEILSLVGQHDKRGPSRTPTP